MNFEAAGTFGPEVLKEALCITDVRRLSARHSKDMRTWFGVGETNMSPTCSSGSEVQGERKSTSRIVQEHSPVFVRSLPHLHITFSACLWSCVVPLAVVVVVGG